MKKICGLFLLLALVVSCKSEEGVWNELTDGEKDYVRQRDTEQCLEETAETFLNFRNNTTVMYNPGSLYQRERSFTSKLNDSANNVSEERLIRIWKNTDTYIIFYVEETIGTNLTKQFIRVAKTENDTMITALQTAYCGHTLEYGAASETGPVTATKTVSANISSGGRRETKYTYNYAFSEIAFWENYRKTVTLTEFDINNVQTTTKTFTSVLTENANPVLLPTDYTTLTSALCYIDTATYNLPYALKCDGTYTADMVP